MHAHARARTRHMYKAHLLMTNFSLVCIYLFRSGEVRELPERGWTCASSSKQYFAVSREGNALVQFCICLHVRVLVFVFLCACACVRLLVLCASAFTLRACVSARAFILQCLEKVMPLYIMYTMYLIMTGACVICVRAKLLYFAYMYVCLCSSCVGLHCACVCVCAWVLVLLFCSALKR